ncbi:MAG: sterol desaturase family protein [Pseudomonadota bacterium]
MDSIVIKESPIELIFMFTLGTLTLAMLLEAVAPRRQLESSLAWRWVNNFSLGAITWYTSAAVSLWLVFWIAQWGALHGVGLLRQFSAGPVLGFFVLLVVAQFLNYWIHYAYHNVSWLWPFHALHHADTDFDVSTSYRNHPLEPLISMPFTMPLIIMLGVEPASALAYRLFAVFAQVFSHSNIRVPAGLERYLRLVILTPDYHRVHHCSDERYTNSNYGSLVPWFDYLFGTAKHRPCEEQESMELGLEYLREPRDNRLDQQLLLPFKVPSAARQSSRRAGMVSGTTD